MLPDGAEKQADESCVEETVKLSSLKISGMYLREHDQHIKHFTTGNMFITAHRS